MSNRYRADQVGSLLRPPALLEARAAYLQGALSQDALRTVEDLAILELLDMQRQVGIDVYTDGELRRGGWVTGPLDAIAGFVPAPASAPQTAAPPITWRGEHVELLRPQTGAGNVIGTVGVVVGEKLRAARRITGHESAFLKQHAPGPFKVTMPSPTWYLRNYRAGVSDRVYPTRADLLCDLVAIMRDEVQTLVDEGVPYVQIDSIRYVFDFTEEAKRRAWQEQGIDPDAAVAENVEADNALLDGLTREGVTFGLHMCRGNNRSNWYAEGGYDRIAEQAFASLQFDRLLLEYDSERAGGFEPLRHVRKGTTVVLGLVSSKVPHLESRDDLLRRIEEAARYVPIEHLALSPQCGFASMAPGNVLTADDQRRKLELVVDTARRVWGAS